MKRKTEIVRVRIGNRVESFANAEAAESYRRKWGGEILAGNIAPLGPTSKAGAQDPGKGRSPDGASFTGPPVFSPGAATLLGLMPADCSKAEFETAWRANHSQAATLDVEAIREALIRPLMKMGFSRKYAEQGIRMRFRKLFASELAKASGVNERAAGNERTGIGPRQKFSK